MKSLLVQLTPVVPCPLHVAPCAERASVLQSSLKVLDYCYEVPHKPSLLQGESFLTGQVLQHLITFVVLLWTLSARSISFVICGDHNWTQYSFVSHT